MPEQPAQPRTSEPPRQLTQTESDLLYDEMLATGRIIQVTSGGVRVFDKTGVFVASEVKKARKVFPHIDYTPGLERMVDRLIRGDEAEVERIRTEVYRSVYKPIKQNLDTLIQDSRVFFADSSTLGRVRTDLQNVVDRLDLLTLSMLNDILSSSALEFRRRMEAGVYSGLAGSVIFGDYKRKLNDKKVVEDLIMMGIVFGLGQELKKSASFQELCRTSKRFYDVEKIIDDVKTHPNEPSNVLSEILAVALKYIAALDRDEDRDPLNALVALMAACKPAHAIAVGALVQKYAVNEYLITFMVRDEAFHEQLQASEDHFELVLRERMAREATPATRKLGDMFIRHVRYVRTIKLGFDITRRLDAFIGALLPVKSHIADFIDQLGQTGHPEWPSLMQMANDTIDTIDACLDMHEKHADPANWPDFENMPGAAYLIAYRQHTEIEYRMQHTICVIEACYRRATESVGPSAEAVGPSAEAVGPSAEAVGPSAEPLRDTFMRCRSVIDSLAGFRASVEPQPFNIATVLRAAVDLGRRDKALRVTLGIPTDEIIVNIDPIGLEQVLVALLDRLGGMLADPAARSDGSAARTSMVISVVASASEHRCFLEIKTPLGRLPEDITEIQHRFEAAAPSATFRVNADKAAGLALFLEFRLVEKHADPALHTAHA